MKTPVTRFLFLLIVPMLFFFLDACSSNGPVRREEEKILLITGASMTPDSADVLLELAGSRRTLVAIGELQQLEEDSLKPYGMLVLAGLDVSILSTQQQADIERYVQAGNGLMGFDLVLPSRYTWPWLAEALKGVAEENPPVEKVKAGGPEEPRLVKHAFDGGRLVLINTYGQGSNPFADRMEEMTAFLLGKNTYNYSKAHTQRPPGWDRFTRVVLDDYDINEPMELAVLPDGRVLFIERRGRMKLYEPEKKASRIIATFDVCTEGNYEDGLLGLTLDPDFENNQLIYLYYSPPCDTPSQFLSRFLLLGGDSLVRASEKVILKVDVQRETCCHSGGSIAFGPDGNLWLSTGDNTSSKESDGYSPLDERPGRGPYDSQKSSANTHDLRGKVLRIKPNSYGSYDIPDGNLFPKDGTQGRPEIYAMGCRNPFRIAVDPKTGYLYWGDVGPDVGQDGRYGPQSYDEWNQARKPGYFGWPYFQADNKAFPDRNFATDEVGDLYDPAHPVNDSPHNTGSRELPPAQPAFIWYPKGPSPEFPMLGQGSNSAMAGPIYYPPATAANSSVKFPSYYHGKWFIYEWARSWVQVVTFDEEYQIARIEPFLPDETFSKPIEMEVGPDGAIYMLEYGQNYFLNNPEAQLVRIEYAEGNRLPIPALAVDKPNGAAPHTATFSAAGTRDYDKGDELRYEWLFDGSSVQATGREVTYTFSENGVFRPKVRVTDSQGGSATAEIEVRVGNAPPAVAIEYAGNQSFFFGAENPAYQVRISDPEDEAAGGIDPTRADVSFVYVDDGNDLELLLGGNASLDQASIKYLRGQQLIKSSDCASCHSMDVHSVGPSYREVAERYHKDPGAVDYLAGKIISGGNGNWGEKIMAGHPQHSLEETAEMARYILSLAAAPEKGLPLAGTLRDRSGSAGGAYLLAATYTDGGANGMAPLSARDILVLRDPTMQAEGHDLAEGVGQRRMGRPGRERVVVAKHAGHIVFTGLDLSGIGGIEFQLVAQEGGEIECRSGSPTGPLLGTLRIAPGTGSLPWKTPRMNLAPSAATTDVCFVFRNAAKPDAELFLIDGLRFEGAVQ